MEHKNEPEYLLINKKSKLWIMHKKLIHQAPKEFGIERKPIRNWM